MSSDMASVPADLRAEPGAPAVPSGESDVVLDVQHVSKVYRLYERPQDRLKEVFGRRFGRHYGRDFRALEDVSFQLHPGDSLGIVGRNGAGKSTLLQIIAGTLTPTTGQVKARGRVAALLELGSGFNPQFTGRENIKLNATILGFTPAQIAERFDDIAAFADVGQFLDQPVKVYSSGMLVRLAFAVQAHLDPDVLIVDEALSVGDVYFQHRCTRRIKQLLDRGTLLLFVSHATETVKRFCRFGLWLEGGRARYLGEAGVAVEKYLAFMRMREAEDWRREATHARAASDTESASAAGGGEPQASPFDLERCIPEVAGSLDLSDDRLFVRGRWEWVDGPGTPIRARLARDAEAVAAFRVQANGLRLRFARGPSMSDVKVAVDGKPKIVSLRSGDPGVESVSFQFAPGTHTVLVGPAEDADSRGEIVWLGGDVEMSPPLQFRVDPLLASNGGEVERYGNGKARLTAVELLDWSTLAAVTELRLGQRVRLRLHAERLQAAGPRVEFSYIVRDRNRIDLFGTTTIDQRVLLDPTATRFVVEFAFDVRLGPGSYSILAAFVEGSDDLRHLVPMDQIDLAKVFTVTFDPARPVWYVFDEPVVTAAHAE